MFMGFNLNSSGFRENVNHFYIEIRIVYMLAWMCVMNAVSSRYAGLMAVLHCANHSSLIPKYEPIWTKARESSRCWWWWSCESSSSSSMKLHFNMNISLLQRSSLLMFHSSTHLCMYMCVLAQSLSSFSLMNKWIDSMNRM